MKMQSFDLGTNSLGQNVQRGNMATVVRDPTEERAKQREEEEGTN